MADTTTAKRERREGTAKERVRSSKCALSIVILPMGTVFELIYTT
jgi:hypothetical protein